MWQCVACSSVYRCSVRTLGQLHHAGAQPGHDVVEQEGADRVGGEPGQDGEEPHRHPPGPLRGAPGGQGSEVRGRSKRKIDCIYTALTRGHS